MADPPELRSPDLELVDTWTETAADLRVVTVQAHNALYEDPSFHERVRRHLRGDLDESPRSFFTTGLSFSRPPPESTLPENVLGIAASHASREFEESLGEDGLLSVEATGSRDLALAGGRTAKAFRYDAAYPFDAASVADGDPGALVTLPVRVWAAIWPTRRSFEMAGGVYPLRSLADAAAEQGYEPVAVDVQARPNEDRSTVFQRIRTVADGSG